DALSDISGEVEKWVAEQARTDWIPPPPEKAVKKKKMMARHPAVARQIEAPAGSAAVAQPEAPAAATILPQPASPDRDGDKDAASPPIRAGAAGKTRDAPKAKKMPESATEAESAPIPAQESILPAEPASPKPPPAPPPVIKRLGTTVRGSAAVGQASADTIAAIKLAASKTAGGKAGEGEIRRSAAGPAAKTGAKRLSPRSPAGAHPPEQPISPGADLAAKPIQKHRVKAKLRASQDDERDVAEKKTRLSRRSRSSEVDWGFDDLAESGEELVQEESALDAAVAPLVIEEAARSILSVDDQAERSLSGFKHKRADFKSKRLHNELPASFAEIDNDFTRSLAGSGRRRRSGRGGQRRVVGRRSRSRRIAAPIPRAPGQEAVVRLGMTLRDISVALGVKLQEILSFMLSQGGMVQVNDILSEEDINRIASKFAIPLKWENEDDLEEELVEEERQQSEDFAGRLAERPPVVTFMGHVDHGKTSLLDAIRNTRVVDGEHGGITQHIGAYSVVRNGKRVTFLDTPGHEAFSAMRARGANLTDIAVLVVAADDGVMPQTEEASAHAKNAGVPVVVAINKCDLPAANPDRVRQELANRLNLLPEEWGGQVGMVNVSAHTKEGMDNLIERILLEAEVLELRANPDRQATGFVIEASMSEGQGVIATLLVTDGTLHVGDIILCSNGYGKIRFMFDEFGRPAQEAGPGMPVRLSGLSAVPETGDKFFILADLHKAKAIAEQRERESRAAAMAKRQHVTLENLTSHLAGSGKRELSVIVKADVMGSLEVIEKTLREMATSEVGVNIIHAAVGGINHADVILADASDAIVIGFHVGAESQARFAAMSLGVQIRTYHIIYRIFEDIKASLEGLLPPEEKEIVQGHVEIRQVFRSSKVGAIAGCHVLDGQVQRTNRIRLFRNQVVIYEGTIQSLRRVKDDVREVKAGFECGLKIAGYDGIEEGDVIEAFSIEEVARKL
ncbi:MAG: translation initiation factor IF-2, partial [Planctomycetota bacterium]|nr:translation initiation factor IF-2 [Planctomycetota bacterium]